MTAVVIDRDVLVVVLEDHARMRGITAALQGGESTARKVIVVIFAKTAVVFIRSVTVLLVVPYGTVLQLEVDLPLAEGKTGETGILIHHGDINAACVTHGANIADQIYSMAACRTILDIDKDLSGSSGEKRHRIVSSVVNFCF